MTTGTTVTEAALLQQAPDGIIFADLAGNVVHWNAAAERIFGFSAEQAIGANLDFIIPEQFRQAHWAGFERATSTGVTKYAGQALPTKALHADGHEFYVELSFSIVRAEDGTIAGALAHARDITERFTRDRDTRRQMRELQQELESYRAQAAGETPDDGKAPSDDKIP